MAVKVAAVATVLTTVAVPMFAQARPQDETVAVVPKVDGRDEQIVRLKSRLRLVSHRWRIRGRVILRSRRVIHQLRRQLHASRRESSPSSSSTTGGHDWDAVAQCESSGDWHKGDGIGPDVTGGLQIATSTWRSYGGTRYAAKAMYATRLQQIAIAERVLAGQGVGAWPNCGRFL